MPKISELPAADTLDTTDIVPVVQGSVSKRTTVGAIRAGTSSGTSAVPRLGILRVASNQAPADVKDQCDFELTGTNDQTVINNALLAASRPVDGFGGIGAGCVELVGGDAFTSHNGTTTITMYPSTWLRGSGMGTLIQPRWPTNTVDRGAVELLNTGTSHAILSDLSIGRPLDVAASGHAVKWEQSGSTPYDLKTGSDPQLQVRDLNILKMRGKGVFITGTDGGARGTKILSVNVWSSGDTCFDIDSSDAHVSGCAGTPGAAGHGFHLRGGSAEVSGCKAYYVDGAYDGFLFESSRAIGTDLVAQDCARWGFNLASQDGHFSSLVADSNSRQSTTGGAFRIASSGMYEALSAYDRNQTPASRQLQGIVFAGTPQVNLTARISVPSGTAHVVGAPNANSFMRVVREGLTMVSMG